MSKLDQETIKEIQVLSGIIGSGWILGFIFLICSTLLWEVNQFPSVILGILSFASLSCSFIFTVIVLSFIGDKYLGK